jgi:hypothetical protein
VGLREEATNVRVAYDQTAVAQEEIKHLSALVERKMDELQYVGYFGKVQGDEAVLSNARSTTMIRRLRILRHENPQAKQAMKLAMRFTFGRGVSYLVKDERAAKIWDSFWKDQINQVGYTSMAALKQRFDEALTDGENYFICATTPGVAPCRWKRLWIPFLILGMLISPSSTSGSTFHWFTTPRRMATPVDGGSNIPATNAS